MMLSKPETVQLSARMTRLVAATPSFRASPDAYSRAYVCVVRNEFFTVTVKFTRKYTLAEYILMKFRDINFVIIASRELTRDSYETRDSY